MSFYFTSQGEFESLNKFLEKCSSSKLDSILEKFGDIGVEALSSATPKDSGKTATSWTYEVEKTGSGVSIHWKNTNVNQGVNIAVIIHTGHGTGTGGYVSGREYINTAIRPVFDKIADSIMKEVSA